MNDDNNKPRISKGITKLNAAGQKIEERWLTVTGDKLEEVEKVFNRQSKRGIE